MYTTIDFLEYFRYFKFIPNNPGLMLGKVPTEEDRGKITMQRILKSLPPDIVAFKLLAGGEVVFITRMNENCVLSFKIKDPSC